MGIWANLLGTIEGKINFAAIPANNSYTSNERTEIASSCNKDFGFHNISATNLSERRISRISTD
jgi:hypothetical protein